MTTAVRTLPNESGVHIPSTFAGFRDAHTADTIVVCGCGASLLELSDPSRFVTIGVNDVGRLFTPDYLVVLNSRSQFTAERYRFVEQTRARALFTQLPDAIDTDSPIVRFRLGRYRGTDITDRESLPYTRNSPYVALCLAMYMGARRIGLIGVDFTDHHFFGATGVHPLTRQVAAIDDEYRTLRQAAEARGIEIVNLSATSRLTAFRKSTIDAFESLPRASEKSATRPLRIVSYATTPVAGVPAILSRCISERTAHVSRCVWATRAYGNGVEFAGDLEWNAKPADALAEIAAADAVIVHNGKVDPRHERLLEHKRVVTLAHNYMWNVDRRFADRGGPTLVVGQYQATLPEFDGWTAVPNPVPIWEPAYAPETKPDQVTICYTPSGRHEQYPEGHRLYWHGKGYDTTMRVLESLARRMAVRLDVILDRQIPHDAALAMKRRAHIVIDECVTGSYHRNSLEGLAAGCVVVNGVGLHPGVREALLRCAPQASELPFVFSNLARLEEVLGRLVERGPEALAAEGARSRAWMEQHWNFSDQWTRVWESAVTGRARAATPVARAVSVAGAASESSQVIEAPPEVLVHRPNTSGVSVVVPHGGTERLPHLGATLATLRQRRGVDEIIVVEMGETPVAKDIASRWADAHLFLRHSGPFERGRALNAGSAIATRDLVLWHDNDLLTPAGLIENSIDDFRSRQLDYLVPYTSVRYLSESDSQAVLQGQLNPDECLPVRALGAPQFASGGMGLVSRAFLSRFGGHIEGFLGWGGEDNAWNHKAGLLGRYGTTRRPDQHVHHLYHALSNGYTTGAASAQNPHYQQNVDLLGRVAAIQLPEEFARCFPPAPPATGTLVQSREPQRGGVRRLPVWSYWEGPCPAWIEACRKTIVAHAQDVRILTPATFARLRDRDRDIDISRLSPPHRADYVRAFLLRRYGGLWIDADCLVMQALEPVLDLLAEHEFVGHRERAGLISNAFIAACPGSRIAAAFYEQVCQTLRSRRRIAWNGIGADPLTAIVAADETGWFELRCERVQPICWSQPEQFFAERDERAHAEVLDKSAICYMLSNGAINNYVARHAGASLSSERTFFSFLRHRALEGTAEDERGSSVCPSESPYRIFRRKQHGPREEPGTSLEQTAELRERLPLLLQELGVRSMLDAPCGDLTWMQHVRHGLDEYVGVDALPEVITENEASLGGDGRRFICADVTRASLPTADAVFCRDLLVHMSFDHIFETLRNFKRSGATYLMTTSFTGERPNHDIPTGGWRTVNLTLPPFRFPPPLRVVSEKCTEGGGRFNDKSLCVWRFAELDL